MYRLIFVLLTSLSVMSFDVQGPAPAPWDADLDGGRECLYKTKNVHEGDIIVKIGLVDTTTPSGITEIPILEIFAVDGELLISATLHPVDGTTLEWVVVDLLNSRFHDLVYDIQNEKWILGGSPLEVI